MRSAESGMKGKGVVIAARVEVAGMEKDHQVHTCPRVIKNLFFDVLVPSAI